MSSRSGRSADTWIGYKTFDLSEERTKELVTLPTTTSIVPIHVDGEAYFRFGQENAPPIPLHELNNINFDNPIGQVYMDNEAGSEGDVAKVILGRGGSLSAESAEASEVAVTNWDAGTLDTDVSDWNAGPVPETPNADGVNSDSVTGDGSFTSQAIPDGFALAIKADPDNADTAYVDDFPLGPAEGVTLWVDNFDVPAVTFDTQTDTMHAIVEAP